MLPQMKLSLVSCANISDVFTKTAPVCLLSSPTSSEPNFISLAPIFLELAYFAILFILQSIIGRINNIGKWANSVNYGARVLRIRLLDCGADRECSGISFVEISKIFALHGTIFFWNGTTWQSISHLVLVVLRLDEAPSPAAQLWGQPINLSTSS